MARASQLLTSGRPPGRAVLRYWLTRTFSGRAIAAGAALKVLAFALTLVLGASPVATAVDTFGDLALIAGAVVLGYQLFVEVKRTLLWRVRRKLTVSYIFIGFIPALLIITFFLLCGLLLLNNFSAYLAASSLRELQNRAQLLAQTTAANVAAGASTEQVGDTLQRQLALAPPDYSVSMAVVPGNNPCGTQTQAPDSAAPIAAGSWTHQQPPASIPSWIGCEGYAGVTLYTDESLREGDRAPGRLVARAVAWPPTGDRRFAVVVDVPLVKETTQRLFDETGVEVRDVVVIDNGDDISIESSANLGGSTPPPEDGGAAGLFRRRFDWFAGIDVTKWENGERPTIPVPIAVSPADVYNRITPIQRVGDVAISNLLLFLVGVVGGLFLLIQLVAFGMGLALARSITGSVHELFAGTERIRRGDFTGRIAVQSRDQLGELADSFNSMTSSIEDLLQEKAEKERMEQELRIARSIQMSLLPQGPMTMPGVSLTAHCEPAREVGGDYYDFLPIDDHTIGILIADVAGKGTSAALYMAELKGIVLSLSRRHTSPRELLIEADRIISRHLDSRSFITVTYLVVDSRAGIVRYARAGHCPLVYVPGPYAQSRTPRLLAPDGLVLGLQLDEGQTFSRLLEEVSLPLGQGDLFLLYTDGLPETMNAGGEFFGDARLAELVAAHADLPADELRERILRDIGSFAGPAPQHDDMTMVLLRVEQVAEPTRPALTAATS